jgi:hypothetical protein
MMISCEWSQTQESFLDAKERIADGRDRWRSKLIEILFAGRKNDPRSYTKHCWFHSCTSCVFVDRLVPAEEDKTLPLQVHELTVGLN